MRRPTRAGVLALVLLLAAGRSRAHVVSDREVQTLRRFRADSLARLLDPDAALANGLAGANRAGWRHVAHQAHALLPFMAATAHGDTAAAERGWAAIELAFTMQQPDGSFRRAAAMTPAELGLPHDLPAARIDDAGAALYLGELCRALVAMINGPMAPRFRWRYALLKPKLQRSLDALVARGDALMSASRGSASMLMTGAECFLIADGIYHEPRYGLLGQRWLVAALATKDLATEPAGASPWQVARTLARLQTMLMYFPTPSMERAESTAVARLDQRLTNPRRAAGDTPSLPADLTVRRAALTVQFHRRRAPGVSAVHP